MSKKEFFKPIIVLSVICLVTVAALAATYQFTLPYIEAANLNAAAEAMKEVFPAQAAGGSEITFEQGDPARIGEDSGILDYSLVYNEAHELTGAVVTVGTKGYGGTVKMMIGVGMDGAVTGLAVLEHTETPGLGSKAAVPEYLRQYIGMKSAEPDLISGATVTSTAIKNGVQAALDFFGTTVGGEA